MWLLVVAHRLGLLQRRYLTLVLFGLLWISAKWWVDGTGRGLIIPLIKIDVHALLNFGTYFAAGVVLFLFRDKISFHWSLLLLGWLLWMGLFLLPFTSSRVGPVQLHWFWFLAIPYLLMYVSFRPGMLNRFGRLGDVSYGLYIYGLPIQQLIISYFHNQLSPSQLTIYTFALLLPISWLSWHLVEKSALRWKKQQKVSVSPALIS